MSWVFAPDCSATAVREPLVETAKPWKQPGGDVGGADADHLLVGLDLVAAAGREARRGGDGVGERDQRDADGRDEQRADVADSCVHGNDGRRARRCGSEPTVGTPSSARSKHRRDDGRADHRDEHRRDLRGDPRQDEEHGEHADADDERRPRRSRRGASKNARTLVDEAVGVGREPEQLRELAHDDRDREAVHVADLDLAREQVGDEPELAEPEPISISADEQGEHPGERDRASPASPPTSSGVIAAKISGDTDESGPSTSTRDGPKTA